MQHLGPSRSSTEFSTEVSQVIAAEALMTSGTAREVGSERAPDVDRNLLSDSTNRLCSCL